MNLDAQRGSGWALTMRRATCDRRSATAQSLIFDTRWFETSHAVITLHGEVDASNAGSFLDGVLTKVVLCRALTLDLRSVEFFSSAGYSALKTLAQRCQVAGVRLTVVPGTSVRRVLQICGAIPGVAVGDSVPVDA